MSKFSMRLVELRTENNLTQAELAKRLGISRSALGMYEGGKREPGIEILENIADLFNVDMDYLLGNTDKTTKVITRKELPLTPTERRLLEYYRKLSDAEGGRLLGYAERLAEESQKDTSKKMA